MTCAHCETEENVLMRKAMAYGPLRQDTPLCTECWRDVLGFFPERPKE